MSYPASPPSACTGRRLSEGQGRVFVPSLLLRLKAAFRLKSDVRFAYYCNPNVTSCQAGKFNPRPLRCASDKWNQMNPSLCPDQRHADAGHRPYQDAEAVGANIQRTHMNKRKHSCFHLAFKINRATKGQEGIGTKKKRRRNLPRFSICSSTMLLTAVEIKQDSSRNRRCPKHRQCRQSKR